MIATLHENETLSLAWLGEQDGIKCPVQHTTWLNQLIIIVLYLQSLVKHHNEQQHGQNLPIFGSSAGLWLVLSVSCSSRRA